MLNYYTFIFCRGSLTGHYQQQPFNRDELKRYIQSEIRTNLFENVKSINSEKKSFPPVKILPETEKLRILVTGGSGFVGSNLVDRLLLAGHQVTVVDNMFTGRKKNVQQWIGHPNFNLIIHDVIEPIMIEVDQIYHLACPASPPHYQVQPLPLLYTILPYIF